MTPVQYIITSATLSNILFGCLGNLLSSIMFIRRKSSINMLLATLSVVDFCLLIFAIPVFVMPNWENIYSPLFQALTIKFLYPINLMFQTCGVYIIVLITIERYMAICWSLKVRSWCTTKRAKQSVCSIVIFSIAYNFIRFWEYSLKYDNSNIFESTFERNLRDPQRHPYYGLWYYSSLYLFTHFTFPFCLIIILNYQVSKEIMRARKDRKSLTRKQIKEHSTTTMLLTVSVTFAICNTLPFLLNFAECIKGDLFEAESTASIAYYINDFSNFLVIFNSSVTWIFYVIFSAKYRQDAAKLLRCTKGNNGNRMSFISNDEICVNNTSNNSSIKH